jgi:hypothetical protein
MNALVSLLGMIAGATAAIWLDREYTGEYGQKIKISDTNTLTITPGAMASAALALGAAFMPGSSKIVAFFGGLAGGGLVYEGAKLAEDQVLPLLGSPKTVPSTSISTTAPVPAMAAGFRRGIPTWQTRQALRHFGQAA